MTYELRTGDSLRGGDKIVNVGRVESDLDSDGMFYMYVIDGGDWDLHTGKYVRKQFTKVFHAADYVTVEV